MIIGILRVCAILCTAVFCGKLISRCRLPAILGWLIAGIVFGPFLAQIVTQDVIDSVWYKIMIHFFECFAGVMIGREMIFKQLASSGKQIIGITFIQSIGTFLLVSLVFAVALAIAGKPIYPAFLFGGIALATAPAPALSIVNEYHTKGPVTKTLIPLAAIDDVIGVVVFFTVITVISAKAGEHTSLLSVAGIVLLPFAIGILTGAIASLLLKRIKSDRLRFVLLIVSLCLSAVLGLLIDFLIYGGFRLNYLLIGMSFSAAAANMIPEKPWNDSMKRYSPLLNLALVIVIVNLGMPLDYRLIAGAGLYTVLYILSRAAGKIGFAWLGGKVTHAQPTVTKYLGFTLLPHSGVSLVFTGITVSTLSAIQSDIASLVSGTIVAAAIINEIIAVLLAKFAFQRAGEIGQSTPAAENAVLPETP